MSDTTNAIVTAGQELAKKGSLTGVGAVAGAIGGGPAGAIAGAAIGAVCDAALNFINAHEERDNRKKR